MAERLLCWTDEAWQDYVYWQGQDRKTLKRINKLIEEVRRSPFDGIGKPESLKENLSGRSEEHTSELQSLMRISYAVFCLKKKTTNIATAPVIYLRNHHHAPPNLPYKETL